MLKQYPRVFYLKLIHHKYSTIAPNQNDAVYNLSNIFNPLSGTQLHMANL